MLEVEIQFDLNHARDCARQCVHYRRCSREYVFPGGWSVNRKL